MKLIVICMILLMFSPIYASNLERIIFYYFERGETFRSEEIKCNNKNYEIVISKGEELFIFENINDRYYFIKNKQEIKNVLECLYESKNMSVEAQFERLEEAKIHVENFLESRGTQENLCKQYTGTDTNPCYDILSCLVSCETVYICEDYAQGVGKPFLELVIDYQINVDSLDLFENKYESLFERAEESKTLNSLEQIENKLQEISRTARNLESTELTSTYNFCPQISYKLAELTSARIIVSDIEKNVKPLFEINNTVNRIYSETHNRRSKYEIPNAEIQILIINGQFLNSIYISK